MKFKFLTLLAIVLNLSFLLIPRAIFAQERRNIQSDYSDNYVGVGVSTSGLAAYSKFSLSDKFAIRPMLLFDNFDDDFKGTVIVPLTYELESISNGATPFIGIGGGSSTENFDVGLELSAGLDYTISKRFTATGVVNIQLFGTNDIDAIFGLGFNL